MPGWFDTPDEKTAQRNLDFQSNLQTITPHPDTPTHPFPSQSEGDADERSETGGDARIQTAIKLPLPLPRRLTNPDLATLEILLLPNRHHLLQPVDEI